MRSLQIVVPLLACLGSHAANADVMSCDELIRLKDDKVAWAKSINKWANQSLGWVLWTRDLVAVDESGKLLASSEVDALTWDAKVGDAVGTKIFAQDVALLEAKKIAGPIKFVVRWIGTKPNFIGKTSRCAAEDQRTALPSVDQLAIMRLTDKSDLDSQYTLVIYDTRKNILISREVNVRSQKIAITDHSAALAAAIKSSMFLERCADFGASGQPISQIRLSMADIERTAARLKIDVVAARTKAADESKSELDMWDMFVAMRASMNYQQRDSVRQFCALQNVVFIASFKQFTEARNIGR